MKTFTVKTEISLERVGDLLCCAFEGGSNGVGYWCRIMKERAPQKLSPPVLGGTAGRHSYIDYPLTGGAVICRLYEEETDEKYKPLVLDGTAIQRGLDLMPVLAPRSWGRLLSEEEDANDGDLFVQLCLLGSLVYG